MRFVQVFLGLMMAATGLAYGACPSLLDHRFARLQDGAPQSLCQFQNKVLLVVNTASYCGFTSQYEGLVKLYEEKKDQGLVVLGFPSNDFSQEPGSNEQVADLCFNTYGVAFPMFEKSGVRGEQANPFYQALRQASGSAPKWNFHKYLISRDGSRVESFNSLNSPDGSALRRAIDAELSQR
ncbi:MAG: glutathione peroxidase [Proteobacteria bacterium]|nr:glutathione peroxidase [Pseudomonadota bacterium]MDA1329197.1 glutathione peroxidase [Pseudomonadota bacterium]